MDSFDRAGSVYSSRISEVLGNLRIRETYSFFVRYQGELFKRDGMRRDLKAELGRALNIKDATESVLHRGFMIQLYGAFERLVSDLVEAVLVVVQSKADKYSDLNEDLRNAHTVGSARLLAKLHDRTINGVSFDFASLQANMAACFSDASEYRLTAEPFTALLGVCTAERVDSVFETLKLGKAFDDALGRDPRIKAWAGNAGTREALRLARDKLNATVRLRNQIAHGAADPQVLDTEVKDAATFLSALGPALLEKAREKSQ